TITAIKGRSVQGARLIYDQAGVGICAISAIRCAAEIVQDPECVPRRAGKRGERQKRSTHNDCQCIPVLAEAMRCHAILSARMHRRPNVLELSVIPAQTLARSATPPGV